MSLRLKIVLILLAVLGGLYIVFILMAPSSLAPAPDSLPQGNSSNGSDLITNDAQTVAVTKSYASGEYTMRGTIQLPTPCYDLVHTVRIMESYPEQVMVDFTSADQGGVCIQIIDERPFEVKFKASEKASIRATLNGKPLILQVQGQ